MTASRSAHIAGEIPIDPPLQVELISAPQADPIRLPVAKQVLDLLVTVVLGVVMMPVVLLIGALIKLDSFGSVFFHHRRVGQGGRRFECIKFRSMVQNADQVLAGYLAEHPELWAEWQRNHKLKNDPRLTRMGCFLRKTSLDELPQLWNVLKGEMSLVGPRPIVEEEAKRYGKIYPSYLKVRPGITGLWQVSGRNNRTYRQRVTLDAYYARNWSIWLDAYIMIKTVLAVLFRHGAY